LLGATLIAGYLVKDHHHSSYDCIGGGIIGATIGYAHFRTSYFGVWDYTVNHIPLPREGFPLPKGEIGYIFKRNELIGSVGGVGPRGVFTHEGGWGRQRQSAAMVDNPEPQDIHEQEPMVV
jgi:hypothetical protein